MTNPDEHMIIALDGPAASGKGTLAKNLAMALNFRHMDTGALYRASAYEVLQNQGDPSREDDALAGCNTLKSKILGAENLNDVLGNPDLRKDETGTAASKLAAIPAAREALKSIQIDFAHEQKQGYGGVILDGRDIGTVICPNAHLKLYIEADTEVRAKRRLKELQSKGLDVTYSAVFAEMRERDARDTQRDTAPLHAASDAIMINTSHLSEEEVLSKALSCVREIRHS
tara:strand:+ start:270 stop:956 length:687 start_codon:yes stop_codon:yes gene_type:complete